MPPADSGKVDAAFDGCGLETSRSSTPRRAMATPPSASAAASPSTVRAVGEHQREGVTVSAVSSFSSIPSKESGSRYERSKLSPTRRGAARKSKRLPLPNAQVETESLLRGFRGRLCQTCRARSSIGPGDSIATRRPLIRAVAIREARGSSTRGASVEAEGWNVAGVSDVSPSQSPLSRPWKTKGSAPSARYTREDRKSP